MNTPNLQTNKIQWTRWKPVVAGHESPDEWQQALINITKEAIESGLFYSTDVHEYVKKHADFIPVEFWPLQYDKNPVEGGLMGMELYMARSYIRESEIRAANNQALENLHAGDKLGTLCIKGKRYTGITVTEIKDCTVYAAGKAGKYAVTFNCAPSAIETMKNRAIERGWRKS